MLVMTNAKIFNVTDDSALLKLMNDFKHELTDYVDNKIAQSNKQTFRYKGFISTEEPTEDLREGLYWYANSFSENTPPDTNFAWNVKEYSNSSWSKDVEYLPNALDMWYNIATKEVWFYLGTQWEKTDFTVDFDKTFFEQNRQLVTLKNNSITDTQIADNAAIAITKIKDLQNTLRNKVNTADVISIKQGGTEASTVEQAKINLGLDQVDNTADIDKPVSTAMQNALDLKAGLDVVNDLSNTVNDKADVGDLNNYLPLTGGTVTGKFTVNDTATFNNGSAISGDVTLVDSSKIQFLKNTDLPIPYINTTESIVTNDRTLNIVAGDVSIKVNTDGTITVIHSKGLGINTTPNTNYSIALEGNAYISGNMFLKSGTIDTNNSNELTYTVDGITKVIAYKSDITVSSVAGKTGNVVLSKADVGLGSVDNTSDIDKPISTAVQTALDNKADKSTVTTLSNTVNSKADSSTVTALQTIVNGKANSSDLTALANTVSGKANSSDLTKYLLLTGGTVTGALTVNGDTNLNKVHIKSANRLFLDSNVATNSSIGEGSVTEDNETKQYTNIVTYKPDGSGYQELLLKSDGTTYLSGRLGIGTRTPTNTLDVNGGIIGQSLTAKKATTSSVALQVSDAANMTSYLQYLYNSGTPILRLLNYSGNSNKGQIDIKDNSIHISSMGKGTGINTAPDSNYTLKVGGKAHFTGAITAPTPATTSNDTTVATTAYVTSKIAASNALSATTATTADGVKNVRDNAQIKVWVGTTVQLPSSRAANTIYMTY